MAKSVNPKSSYRSSNSELDELNMVAQLQAQASQYMISGETKIFRAVPEVNRQKKILRK